MADDLTTIRGIGGARAEALAEDFGVETFADLAALDADDIVSALRARRQAVRPEAAALWIAEAGRRSEIRPEGWGIVALFIVYFEDRSGELRTAARRVDTDTDTQWPGHVPSDVGAWMAEQLGEVPPAPDTSAATVQPDVLGELVTGFRLYQPPGADRPHAIADDGNIHQLVRANAPFVIELDPDAGVTPTDLRLRTKLVGASQPTPRDWSPSNQMPDATVAAIIVDELDPGLYRLHVIVEHEHKRQAGPLILVE
jgi:Helix-hairpin-helix domain